MQRKRKRSTSNQKQKILQIQYRKESLLKLIKVIQIIYGDKLMSTIPVSIITQAYINRLRSFKIIASPGCSVPASILNEARQKLKAITKNMTISVIPAKLEVSLDDFFTMVLTASLILPWSFENNPGVSESVKLKSAEFNATLEDTLRTANEKIYNVLLAFGLCENDMGKIQYYLTHNFTTNASLENGLGNSITISTYKIESSSIIVDNIPRPVIRVGYAFPDFGIDWVSIEASDLKFAGYSSDNPLDVYIQSHALQRLSERIDCFHTGSLHYNMFLSLKFPKIFYDSNHNILIEFRYFEVKAGYFLAEIIEDKILIKTFLFITNNGTPEGQKLGSLTGLQKFDKKYLALDKLSTFMTSDIGKNEMVKELLISAGCGCLLDLYEKTSMISTKNPKQFDAEFMLKYINYGNYHRPAVHSKLQV